MKNGQIKVFRYLLILLIALTVGFIFTQSLLPKETSKKESDAVGDIIAEIIPPDTPTGDYVQKHVRKIAHFVEFMALGAETALYVIFFMKKKKLFALSYPIALIIAFFDETIQIFSGRGPSVTDVWIDFSGFLFATLILYAVWGLVYLIKRKIRG